MPTMPIDRDEYEVTIAELADRRERREAEVVVVTGHHDEHGFTTLRRLQDSIVIEAERLG